ncbi:alpha/beta hydrolase [Actinosynnema sp. ALI-1.44]|nr:alpha/beta hydrolase [Actinosynnema sp. ALI-1.44]
MPEDRHFTRDGARIAYQYTGSGRPLGYAHGVFLSRDAVRRMGLFDFDTLSAGRSLLTFDQRGHGQSTGRPVDADYGFANVGLDLLGVLDDAGVAEPIDFTGSSWGAAAALHAAVIAPERFGSLVLIIPPVAWEDGPVQARQWYTDTADEVDRLGGAAWRAKWAAADPLPIFADYPKFDLTPQVPDELLPAVLRGIGQSDLPPQDLVARLRLPTLIMTWETDPLHPPATAQRLHDLIPGSRLHIAASVADVRTWTAKTAEFLRGTQAD